MAGYLRWLMVAVALGTWTENRSEAQNVFPGKEWQEATPESQGVDPTRLKEAIAHLDAHAGPDGARGLVIVRNGRMIWAGPEADAYHTVFSCTKTFTSTVLGLLVDDGKCSLDSPAVAFEPRLADQYPLYAKIRLRHLASMCGGYQGEVKDIRKEDQPWGDVMAYLNPRRPYFEAGTAVQYNDHDVFLLGKILTLLVREPLQDVFQRRIAGPIGMTKWEWGVSGTVEGIPLNNPPGNPGGRGAGGIKITPREMARFGLLMLRRGNWNGRQLLSASFADEATSNRVPVSVGFRNHDFRGRYGYYWWVNGIMADGKRPWPGAPPKTCMSHGNGGNFCCIVPEWNLVLVRMGSPRVSDQLWDEFFTKLAAAISSDADAEGRVAKPAISQGDAGATERVGQKKMITGGDEHWEVNSQTSSATMINMGGSLGYAGPRGVRRQRLAAHQGKSYPCKGCGDRQYNGDSEPHAIVSQKSECWHPTQRARPPISMDARAGPRVT